MAREPEPPEPDSADPKPPDYERPVLPFERPAEVPSSALRWSVAGMEFGVSVVVFFLVGRFLDAKVGTGPWLSMGGSLVGIAVGTYLLLRPALSEPSSPPSPSRSGEGRTGGAGAKGDERDRR
jgi:hypothetical protein